MVKKNLVKKKFWSKKEWVPKNFGQKKIGPKKFGPKKFWSKKILSKKDFFLTKIKSRSKKLVQKNFGPKFNPEKISVQKNVGSQ